MSVVVSMEDVGPWRKQLTVEVPASDVEAETQRVVREYGRQVRLPGFRQGKVPTDLIRRRFAEDIDREVVERLLPVFWQKAREENEIDPLLPPEVDEVKEREPGAPLTFVATVETRPKIELRNIVDFDLPDPSTEPGIADVDDAVEDLRQRLGEWKPVARQAMRGDRVAAEITEQATAEGGEEGRPEAIEIELGDERVWEELSLAVTGLSAGQEAEFTRHEPAVQHGDHEHPARERKFRVQVVEVQERELPEVDDAFAARVSGPNKTVYDLRESLTQRLREARINDRGEKRQKALLDQLRERHPLELPQGVVKREVEMLVQDYAETLARGGVDVNRAGIEWNKVGEEMLPLAERRVHARLLLEAVADAQGIEVQSDELERALASLARAQGTSTPILRKNLEDNDRLEPFKTQLRRDKTLRHLLGEEETASSSSR